MVSNGLSYDSSGFGSNSTANVFLQLSFNKLIPEWLEWLKGRISRKYFQNQRIYGSYIPLLKDPLKLIKVLTEQPPAKRCHIQKAISSFCKYLDIRFTTDIFLSSWHRIMKLADLSWSWERKEDEEEIFLKQEEALTEKELLDIIKIALKHYEKMALRIWFQAVTGLRTCEVNGIEWNNIDLEYGIVRIMKKTKTKRAFISFLTPNIAKKLKEMDKTNKPFTVSAVKELETLKAIRAKYPKFRYYLLRKFNATYLIQKGIPEPIVDFLQGRKLPKDIRHLARSQKSEVLRKSYLRPAIETVKTMFLSAISELDSKIAKLFEETEKSLVKN